MSHSSDDPRHGRPGPTQRPPAVRPFAARQDVAPPPPRARPIDWDDGNDPLCAPPARRDLYRGSGEGHCEKTTR